MFIMEEVAARHSTYPPFATSVHYTISEHQPTRTTHEIATAELLDDVRVRVSTFGADKSDGQVRTEGRFVDFMYRIGERKRLSVCRGHGVCGRSGKIRAWTASCSRVWLESE